ncbi:translation initiation factor IF-2 [Bacillus sp. AGMB 02131]|uniref:Translation initiation factor IF-2 n=1 Tax=Peribacillus faecalis TaxID=2772559 RepID=A0A927HCC2_9BACI|nr:translation initiation factor IF-2 [Peribacillus faecalis]MBD3109401.1 translation initiation factor IF-2 [Peribacillus faecalis]
MTKVRVYEYAKKQNVSSKVIIEKLKEMNIEVSNHMAAIDDSAVNKLDQSFQPKKDEKTAKANTNQTEAVASENKYEDRHDENSVSKQKLVKKKPPVAQGNKKPGGNQFNKGKKQNRNNRKGQTNRAPQMHTPRKERELPEKITFSESLTVGELAKKLHREPSEIIKKLFLLGVMATINQSLDKDAIELICSEYGVEVEEEIKVDLTDLDAYIASEEEATENTVERPAVVTIMGHVDHGKTTLLDSIRNTKVTEGEAGGITQHIGAYQVEVNDKKITFLDTPGHAAFTTMRARGAKVTDIAIIVVAADDGVMPQTVEAINHAKAAEVPIIIAVNKMDKEAANPDRVMQELTEHNLVPEAWGGDTIFVPMSAKKGEGIDELLEMILLVSEVEEYKANPNKLATGTVIEAQLDKGRGAVATLLVQNGTLKVGDPIVVGTTFGRVRAMVNDMGRRVKDAGPSTPVEITGLNEVPQAGDLFVVFKDEKTARQVGEARSQQQVQSQRNEKAVVTLDNLFEQMKQGEMKEINLIVKGDVQGSVEALSASLQKIEVEGIKVKIIHSGVGAINEYDIMLADASSAIVIGFNVRPDVNAKRAAESAKVDVRLYSIIYKVMEEIESAMKGMLDPEYEEKVIGQAEVRTTFKVSKVGTIAGSYVTEGKITRDSSIRLIRQGIVIFEGEIDALKRFKDDAKEVSAGYECGITIKNYNDLKEGDIIEAYVMEEIERK